MNDGQERTGGLLVARRDGAALLKTPEKSLDFVAIRLEVFIVWERLFPIAFRGNDDLRGPRFDTGSHRVGAVAFVGDHRPYARRQHRQQVIGEGAIGPFGHRQVHVNTIVQRVYDGVDFRAEAPAAVAETCRRGIAFFGPRPPRGL